MASRRFAAIFDLDGTLLDSLKDLAISTNIALETIGLPTLPEGFYTDLVGSGNAELCERALVTAKLRLLERQGRLGAMLVGADAKEQTEATLGETVLLPHWLNFVRDKKAREPLTDERLTHAVGAMFRQTYQTAWRVNTKPYAGIVEVLRELKEDGFNFAVYSNKDDAFVTRIMDACFPPDLFTLTRGKEDGKPLKPNPTVSLEIACQLGTVPERVLFFGDSDIDMLTAREAGMVPIAVLWGFRSAEELKAAGAKRLLELPEQIKTTLWEWEHNADRTS